MTRLIDADALMESIKVIGNRVIPDVRTPIELEQVIIATYNDILSEITNAPTVQREGWVSVPIEPTKQMREAAIREQEYRRKLSLSEYGDVPAIEIYKAMIQAAPTDTE